MSNVTTMYPDGKFNKELADRRAIRQLDNTAVYTAIDEDFYVVWGTMQQIQLEIENLGYSILSTTSGEEYAEIMCAEMHGDDEEKVWRLYKPYISKF